MDYKGRMNFMALQNDRQFQMRASESWIRQIDEWRRKQPDLPSRAEAIRRLVAIAFSHEPKTVRILSREDDKR